MRRRTRTAATRPRGRGGTYAATPRPLARLCATRPAWQPRGNPHPRRRGRAPRGCWRRDARGAARSSGLRQERRGEGVTDGYGERLHAVEDRLQSLLGPLRGGGSPPAVARLPEAAASFVDDAVAACRCPRVDADDFHASRLRIGPDSPAHVGRRQVRHQDGPRLTLDVGDADTSPPFPNGRRTHKRRASAALRVSAARSDVASTNGRCYGPVVVAA